MELLEEHAGGRKGLRGLGAVAHGIERRFFLSSGRRHTRFDWDWSSDVCSSDLPEFAAKPLQFPVALDLCRDQVPESADCDGLRLAAAARRSTSTQAFLPAFANADWRVFAS